MIVTGHAARDNAIEVFTDGPPDCACRFDIGTETQIGRLLLLHVRNRVPYIHALRYAVMEVLDAA